jgi:hypothetical protein
MQQKRTGSRILSFRLVNLDFSEFTVFSSLVLDVVHFYFLYVLSEGVFLPAWIWLTFGFFAN